MENKENREDDNRKLNSDDRWGIAGFIVFAATIILPILAAPIYLARENPAAIVIVIAVEAIILIRIFGHRKRK